MKNRSIAQAALQEAKQVREHMTSHLRAKLEEEQLPLLQQLVEQALVQEDEDETDVEFDLNEAVRDILKESDDDTGDDDESDDKVDESDDDDTDDDDTDDDDTDDDELEESIQSLLADLREEMYGDDDELMVDNDETDDDFYDDEEDDADFLEVYENRKLAKVEKELSETKLALHKMVSLHSLTVNEGIKGSRYSKLLDVLDECTSIKQVDFLVKSTRSVISEQKIANDAKRALNEGSSTVIKPKKANKSKSEFETAFERMRKLSGISGE